MNTKFCGALLTFGIAVAGIAHATDSWDVLARANEPARVNVTVVNESGYTIDELYVSATLDTDWEHDLLGTGVLSSGYHTTITAVPGHYDVKVVDGDKDECVVRNVEIRGDRSLTLTPAMLLHCEGFL